MKDVAIGLKRDLYSCIIKKTELNLEGNEYAEI